jgi:hypothetical protein
VTGRNLHVIWLLVVVATLVIGGRRERVAPLPGGRSNKWKSWVKLEAVDLSIGEIAGTEVNSDQSSRESGHALP